MSGSSGLSGRYAKALHELATEKKIISKIVKDFESLQGILTSTDLFQDIIKSHAVTKANKLSTIVRILKKAKANSLTIKFCGTLDNNGRLIFIHEIIDVFYSEVSRINGEVQAEVTSAFELDKVLQNKVESAISDAAGVKKIVLSTKVDETLIGGLIVKIGSKMIDNSIRTKLNNLEIAMRGTN